MLFLKLKNTTIRWIICVLLLTANSWGQDNQEVIFGKSKTMASQNDYSSAITLIKQLHLQYPNNLDYQFYLAQLHYWSNDNVSAKNELQVILKENANHQEAYDLLIKVDYLLGEYEVVIQKSKEGKIKFPANLDFYNFQEASALEKTDQNNDALDILSTIPQDSKLKKDAVYLETQILKKKKNTMAIGHLFTDFENSTSSLNITSIEYGRKIGRNTIIGRINYGTTNFNHELQTEIETYVKIKTKSYLYFNSGFAGDNGIFPQYRFGTEYFQDFNKMSSSLGAKYLIFDKKNSTLLFTGHLGLNIKEWKIEYRHYLAETNNDWLSSSILNFRRNFESTESYVQLDLQYGSIPYFFLNNESFERLNAFRMGINGKIRMHKNYFIQPIFMYEREEFIPDEYRNRYSIQLILSTRF